MTVQVVDFFSGCGGTSVGLRRAGAKIVAAIDQSHDAIETFRTNFPEATAIERDIADVRSGEIGELLSHGQTLFAGCAPCQPFSKQNRQKSAQDPRRPLLLEFLRFVADLRPDFVVIENVPGLQKVGDDGPFPEFRRALMALSYAVADGVLRAGDFGVPQQRRRLVLVASRHHLPRLPDPVHSRPTVRDAIGHLPALAAGKRDKNDPDHVAMKLSALNLARIRATPEGGGRESWPRHLVPPCHRSHSGHIDTYGRMAWDRPATGLTTRCLSYSNGRFGHPDQDRAISVREAALLQTFPESFAFSGTVTSRGRQIGNAVPPAFAHELGAALFGSTQG